MSKTGDLANRFARIFDALGTNDFSSALTLICPLIDSAGKEIYGIKKNGERFKRVLRDNTDFLYWTISRGTLVLQKDTQFSFVRDGQEPTDLPHAIYKMVRNSLLHEAELSTEIEFNDGGSFGPRDGKISFPKNLVWALALMLTYLPCYAKCCPNNYCITVSGHAIDLPACWGDREKIESALGQLFDSDNANPSIG